MGRSVMQRLISVALHCAVVCVGLLLTAAHADEPKADTSAQLAAPSPLTSLFIKPIVLRGTLGEVQVQVQLHPKEVADEGLEGNYFAFGRSGNILLAGETEEDTLFLEESENGTDISGQWEGKLQGDALTGTWTSADGQTSKPFSLRVLRDETSTASVRKTSNRSAK
jgi:hypothetical protein